MSSPETRIGEKERPWELGAALGRVLGLEGEDVLVDQTPFCYPKGDTSLREILEHLLTLDRLSDANLNELVSVLRHFADYAHRQSVAVERGRHAFPKEPRLRGGSQGMALAGLASRIGATKGDFMRFEGVVRDVIRSRRDAGWRQARIHQDFKEVMRDEEIRLRYEEMSREKILEAIVDLFKSLTLANQTKERQGFPADDDEQAEAAALEVKIENLRREIRIAGEAASAKKEAA